MTEQLSIFELEPYEENWELIKTATRVLNEKEFSYVIPLGTSSVGHSAFRAVFEDKPCTVQIDSEGHIMFKHDDSRFYDYGGEV
ncbi:hypothetical protein [Bacillus toyonensis]|uniref:hypothetical protein n=1 Tax=Bacillus toyonensis TaxID=155322 RepID=UPI000BEFF5BE|nr:hypothetical protein [Bacillus toyonensis]PEM64428.1 hypothetical protein CN625_01575 [Bacillus toyonensis]